MNYKRIILENFKRRTLEEKKLTILLGEDLIKLFNSKLKRKSLTDDGDIRFMENVIIYGYDEMLKCIDISFENYGDEDDDEIYNKFNGIIYNRNEKKYLQ